LIYFKAIWDILGPFGIFYGHLVQFAFVWYIFSGFGTVCHEKSGNPAVNIDLIFKWEERNFYKMSLERKKQNKILMPVMDSGWPADQNAFCGFTCQPDLTFTVSSLSECADLDT
jgi:hypothetical protein